jgi:hypothetical protein
MTITSKDCLAMGQIEEEHQLLLQTEVQGSDCIQQNSTIGIDLREKLTIQKEGMKTVTFGDFTASGTKSLGSDAKVEKIWPSNILGHVI